MAGRHGEAPGRDDRPGAPGSACGARTTGRLNSPPTTPPSKAVHSPEVRTRAGPLPWPFAHGHAAIAEDGGSDSHRQPGGISQVSQVPAEEGRGAMNPRSRNRTTSPRTPRTTASTGHRVPRVRTGGPVRVHGAGGGVKRAGAERVIVPSYREPALNRSLQDAMLTHLAYATGGAAVISLARRLMTPQAPPYQPQQVRFVDQLIPTAAQSAASASRHFLRIALSGWQAALVERMCPRVRRCRSARGPGAPPSDRRRRRGPTPRSARPAGAGHRVAGAPDTPKAAVPESSGTAAFGRGRGWCGGEGNGGWIRPGSRPSTRPSSCSSR